MYLNISQDFNSIPRERCARSEALKVDALFFDDEGALFRLERRYAFGRFVELLFAQSGSQFDATRFAAPCEIIRFRHRLCLPLQRLERSSARPGRAGKGADGRRMQMEGRRV